MKIRSGFISNSSSSSFILAAAVIVDYKKAKDFLDSVLDCENYNFRSVYIVDLNSNYEKDSYDYTYNNGVMKVENFQSSIYLENLTDEKVLVVNILNDEGDYFFEDCDGDIDYDIDIDDLPTYYDWEKELYFGINESNGFSKIEKTFGAGRNG